MRARAMVAALLVVAPGFAGAPRGVSTQLTGVVYDSIAGAPVVGAHVQLLPLEPSLQVSGRRTTQTDSSGRYVLADVFPGRYLAGFLHAKLDSLGLDPDVRRVDVAPGRDVSLDLAVPSPATVIAKWCGSEVARESMGVILGFVRDVGSAALLGDASVAARWSAITIVPGGARASVQETTTRTSELGWFGLCGVPRGAVLLMRVVSDPDSSALLELDVPEHGLLLRDITMQRRATAPAVTPMVSGSVRDPAGQPLPGARVRLWGSTLETRSDDAGEFRLNAPPGTQLLDARMIGYVPTRRVVDVSPAHGARVDFTMSDFPTEIDTVRVLAAATRRPGNLAGFEHRRSLGHGTFLDPDQVERRRPLVFTDLLRGIPGVEIRTVDMMTRAVQMRAINGGSCVPALVVDGMRLPLDDLNVDDVIPADLVKAVEVYPRRIQAPPEYQTMECGTVVVWTGVRGWLARQLKEQAPGRVRRP